MPQILKVFERVASDLRKAYEIYKKNAPDITKAFEVYKRTLPNLQKALAIHKKTMPAMSQALDVYRKNAEPLSRIFGWHAKYRSGLSGIFGGHIPVAMGLNKIIDDYKKVAPIFKRAIEAVLRTNEDIAILLRREGLWLSPYIIRAISIPELIDLTKSHKAGNKNCAKDFLTKLFADNNSKELKCMVKSWDTHPLFQKRIGIINQALKAHMRREFTLSIPALLPVAEGIAVDFCRKNKITVKRTRRKKSTGKVEDALRSQPRSKLKIPRALLWFVENVLYVSDRQRKSIRRNTEFNRHAILHGHVIDYNTEINSLRAFLLLDGLSGLDIGN